MAQQVKAKAREPEFDSYNLCKGRKRELTPSGCPLTSTREPRQT